VAVSGDEKSRDSSGSVAGTVLTKEDPAAVRLRLREKGRLLLILADAITIVIPSEKRR
jgi:hypothetical protein